MDFINKLLKILDEKEITRYKFCKDLGLSKNSINNWENGSYPTIDKIEKIIIYLGISPYDLLEVENKNEKKELSIKEKELLKYFKELPEELKTDYISEIKGSARVYQKINKNSEKSLTSKTG